MDISPLTERTLAPFFNFEEFEALDESPKVIMQEDLEELGPRSDTASGFPLEATEIFNGTMNLEELQSMYKRMEKEFGQKEEEKEEKPIEKEESKEKEEKEEIVLT